MIARGRGAASIQWVEARDGAQHPGTDDSRRHKDSSGPNVSGAGLAGGIGPRPGCGGTVGGGDVHGERPQL